MKRTIRKGKVYHTFVISSVSKKSPFEWLFVKGFRLMCSPSRASFPTFYPSSPLPILPPWCLKAEANLSPRHPSISFPICLLSLAHQFSISSSCLFSHPRLFHSYLAISSFSCLSPSLWNACCWSIRLLLKYVPTPFSQRVTSVSEEAAVLEGRVYSSRIPASY